jgi:ribA/ribD-fused uncharacterized protein
VATTRPIRDESDQAGALSPIDSFFGPHRFLSSFFPAVVAFDGVEYPTAEHAYQAAKTDDPELRRRLRSCGTPGEAKRRGSAFEPRGDWGDVRVDVMRDLVHQKFQHDELRARLVATGAAPLIEGNSWGDRFWGVSKGVGTNHLGNLLMVERASAAGLPPPAIALDLEGTLISNAVSSFARPGLLPFLDWISTRFEQVVLYTAVSTRRAAEVVEALVSLGDAPEWFADLRIVTQLGPSKDLRVIDPGLGHLLLADDQETSVSRHQRDRWVPIPCWNAPYDNEDQALEDLRADLEERVAQLELAARSAPR